MTSTKSKKVYTAKHTKTPVAQSLSQSQKKSASKSRVSSQASIVTSSRGASQWATVEPSEDDDNDD